MMTTLSGSVFSNTGAAVISLVAGGTRNCPIAPCKLALNAAKGSVAGGSRRGAATENLPVDRHTADRRCFTRDPATERPFHGGDIQFLERFVPH